jgi:hypothetical protein
MSTWDDWAAKDEAAYSAVPRDLHAACPNCGHDALRLVFTGRVDEGVGYASFWCDHCLQGIVVSRAPIPPAAVVRSIDDPPAERKPEVPNYTVIS